MESHPINSNNVSDINNNKYENDNRIKNENYNGKWIDKLNVLLNNIERNNVELRNINKDIESAIQFNKFKEGNVVVVTRRGRTNMKNAFHIDEYIETLKSTKGLDPFTKEVSRVVELVRIKGGDRSFKYNEYKKNMRIQKASLYPLKFIEDEKDNFTKSLDRIKDIFNSKDDIQSIEKEFNPTEKNILTKLSESIKLYYLTILSALESGYSFNSQNDTERFIVILRNLINKLYDILSIQPTFNLFDIKKVLGYVFIIKQIHLKNRIV